MRDAMYTQLALYIDGAWVNGNGKGEDVLNPVNEKPLARLPHASAADLDRTLEAAKKGFATWRATSAYDRAKIMRKAADLMRERHDAISKIMVQEQGKVYVEARAEVLTSAEIIEWDAEEGRRSLWPRRAGPRQGHPSTGGAAADRRGRGFHAVEFPRSYAGPEDRRRIVRRLLDHSQGGGGDAGRGASRPCALPDAGLPAGVLNLVFGVPSEISEYLMPEPSRLITFTGSIPVGKRLGELAAAT